MHSEWNFLSHSWYGRTWDSVVIIVTMLWTKQLRIWGVIPGMGQEIFLFSRTFRLTVGPK
jgi:hypothetical protein